MLTAGTRLGNYEIVGLLGVGGMGEVYRARDTKLGRDVALKVLPEAVGSDPGRVSRFEREARLLASVNHPGIAAIYGAEESGETRYLVLELVEGETLTDRLRNPLGPAEALRIARQIADALETAHESGIIHRDLKPSNVMVTPQGRVKILDLGLAKMMGNLKTVNASHSQELTVPPMEDTRPGVILGTVEFMSPEQARGKAIDKRTDIWAFGCILFECFSGRRAFAGESVSDAIASILLREPEWAALPADTPPGVRELLQRCLQKDPNHRLRDIGDARLAIDEVLAEIAPARSSASGVRPTPPARGRRRFVVLGAASALLAGAAVVYLARRPREPAAPNAPRLVAILPFRDLSNAPDGSLIGEGLVETVSARLGGATGIQVVSPAAVIAASTAGSDPARIAQNLGASIYLRGSVQRSADRVRITYSLFDSARGVELAGGTLDGSTSDLFELQDRLVARVSEAEAMPMKRAGSPATGLDSPGEQERYLKAVGLLQHYNTKASVEEAVGILESLAKEAPRSPYVFASLARARLATFDLTRDQAMVPKAEEAATRAWTIDPALVEVDMTLGELRLHTGNAAGAVEAFRRALSNSPTNFDARLGLARALGAARQDADAEKAFREAIALQPTYWGGYSKLAGFYYTRGRYGEAAGAFARVADLTPDTALAFSNLGGAWFLAGDFEKALDAFRRSLALQPTGFAWSNIGTAQFFLGDYAKAAAAFQQAAKLTPDVYRVWANLGDAYRWQSGKSGEARAAYERAVDLCRRELARDPDDGLVRAILASSLAKTGNGRDAAEEIRRAGGAAPADPDVAYQTAVVRTIAGDRTGALEALGRAVQSGYPRALIEKDPELSALRADPRYSSAVGAGRKTSL